MSRRPNTVVIDRLVLEGLELAPERAEWMRAQLEAELVRLLGGQELTAIDVSRTTAPALSNQAIRSDRALAMNLAHRIAASCSAASE